MNIRKAEIAALEAVGELLVFDAQLMENGGVEIVNVDDVFHGVVAEVVGFAVADSRFDSASGGPA